MLPTESITNADDTDLIATDDAFGPTQDSMVVNGEEPLTDFGDTTEESDG